MTDTKAAKGQHTPGPWIIEEVRVLAGPKIFAIVRANGQKIADTLRDSWATEEEQIANAILIAAAPETAAERDRLRDACQVVAALEEEPGVITTGKPLVAAIKLCRAALAGTAPSEADRLRAVNAELLAALEHAAARFDVLRGRGHASEADARYYRAAIAKATQS